jgi:hypothetical protein
MWRVGAEVKERSMNDHIAIATALQQVSAVKNAKGLDRLYER